MSRRVPRVLAMSRRVPRVLLPVVLLLALALATACSSSSSTSSTASTSGTQAGSDSAALAKAQAALNPWLQPVTSIGLTQKLQRVPPHETVAIAQCSQDTCVNIGNGMAAAASALGWTSTRYNVGVTPQQEITGMQQIVAAKPGVVLLMAAQLPVVRSELVQLQKEGAIVIGAGMALPKPGDPLNAVLFSYNAGYTGDIAQGGAMADYMIVHTNGQLHGLYLSVPFFPFSVALGEGITTEVSHLCPACSMTTMPVNPADVGKAIPGQVVSYLQAHPQTNFVAVAYGDIAIGIPEALKAAGLASHVQLMSQAATVVNYEYMLSGKQAADISSDVSNNGWYMMDAAARLAEKQPLPDYSALRIAKITTKVTWNPQTQAYVGIPGYQSQFKALWGV
jgi:ribose transport system substrate-binding protein